MDAPKLGVIHHNWPDYDLEGFFGRASQIGYTHCELNIADVWDGEASDPRSGAESVRQTMQAYGLQASAVAAGNDFLQADPAVWEREVERYRRVCEIVPHVGTDVVRTDGGWNREGAVPEDRWDGMLLEAFKRCADFAEEHDVRIALDNHGLSTNDGEWQLSLIERVGSSRLGVNLDTMNYRWYGHDLDRIDYFYEVLAPFVFHTHLKDGRGSRADYQGEALGDGEIRLHYAIKCLKDAHYDGAWTAEYEGSEAAGGVGYEKCWVWLRDNI